MASNGSTNDLDKVLLRLGELTKETRPITMSIGCLDESRTVLNNVVIIHDAPARIVSAVVSEFNMVSLADGGLHIPVSRA